MVKPSDAQLLATLRVLQSMVDPRTTRVQGGYLVADIVPPMHGRWSLTREVAEKMGLSSGSIGVFVGELVARGLVQAGRGPHRMRRWVVLEK